MFQLISECTFRFLFVLIHPVILSPLSESTVLLWFINKWADCCGWCKNAHAAQIRYLNHNNEPWKLFLMLFINCICIAGTVAAPRVGQRTESHTLKNCLTSKHCFSYLSTIMILLQFIIIFYGTHWITFLLLRWEKLSLTWIVSIGATRSVELAN